MFKIIDSTTHKTCKSAEYNFIFNKQTGFQVEFGATLDADPTYSPYGATIADIEISKVVKKDFEVDIDRYNVVNKACHGCKFCYKGANTGQKTISMKTHIFDSLLSKINQNKILCQVAIGLNKISTCPDFWDIVKLCREKHDVVPNYTTRGGDLTELDYKNTAQYCGAVAVSYSDPDITYGAVEQFIKHGTDQTNIHFVLSAETFGGCLQVIQDCHDDHRLKNLNALVLLSFKDKNNTKQLTIIRNPSTYKQLIDKAESLGVPLGFDSCAAWSYKSSIQGDKDFDKKFQYVTSCCASRLSKYISIDMKYFPCSFMEREEGWQEGISILDKEDFVRDVWNHPQTIAFRNKNIECCKNGRNPCSYFEV